MADSQKSLRQHLLYVLRGEGAHASFDAAVKNFPAGLRGKKVEGFPHTAWMLLEHLRLAQWDILEFSRNRKHASPNWPEGYWPAQEPPPNAGAWNTIVEGSERFEGDAGTGGEPEDGFVCASPVGRRSGRFGEAILVADHSGYHVGQIVMLRKLLGAWDE